MRERSDVEKEDGGILGKVHVPAPVLVTLPTSFTSFFVTLIFLRWALLPLQSP